MRFFINEIELQKDSACKLLIDYIKTNEKNLYFEDNACLYYNLPLYKENNLSSSNAKILILSKEYGLILFDTDDAYNNKTFDSEKIDIFDQTYSQLLSRFIKSPILRKGRGQVNFSFEQILFMPNYKNDLPKQEGIYFFNELNSLKDILNSIQLENCLQFETFSEIRAIIEGSKALSTNLRNRNIEEKDSSSKGYCLQKIETKIKNFDEEQNIAANIIVNGPQRIRGLAGSGKTIVLAKKVATIHLQDPNAKILFTFFTKSLYDISKKLITKFYRQNADVDPNWDNIHIMHSWGGNVVTGVYSNQCKKYGLTPQKYDGRKTTFGIACRDLLEKVDIEAEYDYVVMDEAQDFNKYFYRLCFKLAKGGKLVWGYDQCQNIMDTDIQDTKITFGKDNQGKYLVDFDETSTKVENDIILHKCYRNPDKIIFLAFALGLGIYNDRIIQMLENNSHWEDLGFDVVEGNSNVGDKMQIRRPPQNSPLEIPNTENIINLKTFNEEHGFEEECKYVVDRIKKDIESKLCPEDIMVLSLDDKNSKVYLDTISTLLLKDGIKCNNMLSKSDYSDVHFYVDNNVTLTTVYKAKGNEAASVYIVGIDGIFKEDKKDLISNRNKIFTALTRTKYWLTITGIGQAADNFKKEYLKILSDYPYLNFTMPDKSTFKNMQRDLSNKNSKLNKIRQLVMDLGLSPEELTEQIFEDKDT